MKRLKTFAVLWTLGAAGQSGVGAEPDGPVAPPHSEAATPPPAATDSPRPVNRPEPPAPPIKYLEAGARLFNKGRYDLAAKYLGAARSYRDRLSPNERVVLDVYQEKLDQYLRERKEAEAPAPPAAPAPAEAPPGPAGPDADVVTTSTTSSNRTESTARELLAPPVPAADPEPPAAVPSPDPGARGAPPPGPTGPGAPARPGAVRGTNTWRGTVDRKQKARWQLQVAREHIFRGRYDEAERAVAEARGMDVHWGFFDDTPKKVTESLAKARAKAGKGSTAGSAPGPNPSPEPPRDRQAARARLREARAALAAGRVDEAERIALDLNSWGLRFGLFDDSPGKLASDLAELRRREAVRGAEAEVRSYLDNGAGRTGARRPEGPGTSPDPDPGTRTPEPR